MLKEDAMIKAQKWRGHSCALDLRGARRKQEPLHTVKRMLPRQQGVCIANVCVKGRPPWAPSAFLNRTIPSLFPTRLQSSAK